MTGMRILVFEGMPGAWIARSLEHDLIAEGRTMDLATARLLGFLGAHIDFDRRHNREPLSAFAPAPQACWNAFARAAVVRPESLPLSMAMPWPGMITVAVTGERPTLSHPRFRTPEIPTRRRPEFRPHDAAPLTAVPR